MPPSRPLPIGYASVQTFAGRSANSSIPFLAGLRAGGGSGRCRLPSTKMPYSSPLPGYVTATCTGLSAEMGASKNCVLPPCMTTRSLFWMRSMIHPSPLPGTSLSRSLAVSTPAVRIVARNVKPRGNFAVRTASHLSPALGTPDQSGFTDGFTPLAAASIVLGVSTVEYMAASRNSPFSLSPPRELTPNETGSSGFTGSPPANIGNAAAATIAANTTADKATNGFLIVYSLNYLCGPSHIPRKTL